MGQVIEDLYVKTFCTSRITSLDHEFCKRKWFPYCTLLPLSPSLLLSGDNSSDKKLRPSLVCRSENPCMFAVSDEEVTRNAWIMRQIFCGWFAEYFLPET
jgi:hypothetical protein